MRFKRLQINAIIVYILGGLILLFLLSFWLFNINPNVSVKLSAILSGLITGLVIMLTQILFSWSEFKEIEKIKNLGVRKILPYREGKEFYAKLINGAKDRVFLMGYSADRFMEDFGRANRTDSNALLTALGKGVKVRILVFNPEMMERESDKLSAKNAKEYFKNVESYKNFEYRYYNHVPTHSIVIIDEESLIGPYFPGVKSKDTPCIQISTNSQFAKKYVEYFESEWKVAMK